MEGAASRMAVLARQIALQPTSASSGALDVAAMQQLLEHDNWETRQRMKDLMDTELYTPCVCCLMPCTGLGRAHL